MNIKYMWLDRKYLVNRQLENIAWFLAGKLPKAIQKRVFYLIVAKATTGKHDNTNPGEITAFEAIARWEAK